MTNHSEVQSDSDTDELRAQLLHNLASLFLKMQTVLHVSDFSTQEIVHLSQIFSLYQPIIKKTIQEVLLRHDTIVSGTCLDELVSAVMGYNIFISATAKGEDLSTNKRWKTHVKSSYPGVRPVQHELEPGHSTVHISILEIIQEIFRHTDILDKIKEMKPEQKSQYMSHQDGSYFKDNELLSSEELTLPLLLYTDDLEIADQFATSRKIHKLTAVYWAFADLPSKYRSNLHIIQLAALCKVPDVERFGYDKTLDPLLGEIFTLEKDGVFIDSIDQVVKGSAMYVLSDNLAAHAFAGFMKSFRVKYFCRFSTAMIDQIQSHEVADRELSVRTEANHDHDLNVVKQGEKGSLHGVQGNCVLNQRLDYFHTVSGFPPDVLHDLLEGIVPVELAVCIRKMILSKCFTLQYLNKRIASFPYQHTSDPSVSQRHMLKRTSLEAMVMRMLHCLGCSL